MNFDCWTNGAWAAESWVEGSWCPGAPESITATRAEPVHKMLVPIGLEAEARKRREEEELLI